MSSDKLENYNMFSRKNSTYKYTDDLLDNILNDQASPLTRIINIIPEGSKVLDVGAGSGLLAKLLHYKGKDIIIDGIEPSEYATTIARDDYRNFYNGFVQDYMSEILNEKYDYIVFADVIEHIDNPINVFKTFFSSLDASTKIIISTPNIAFGSVRLSLMCGRFDYVDSGIVESTHLRFYTLDTLKKLIMNFDLNIEKLYYLVRNFNNTEIDISSFKCNFSSINFVSKDKLSHVYQFFLVLTKENVITEEKYFGSKSKFPILEYFFKPMVKKNKFLKDIVIRFYK